MAINFVVGGDPANPEISGETNLPDGTRLNVNALQDDRYMTDGSDMTVAGGKFLSAPLKLNGDPLAPGKYVIKISAPLEAVQPDQVRQLVGTEYENLTGDGFVDDQFGRTIEITRPLVVPGARDRQAEQDRDAKRRARVRDMFERSCAEKQTRNGLPTLTPKAKVAIAECVRNLEAGLSDD